jgi:hypothetical protein
LPQKPSTHVCPHEHGDELEQGSVHAVPAQTPPTVQVVFAGQSHWVLHALAVSPAVASFVALSRSVASGADESTPPSGHAHTENAAPSLAHTCVPVAPPGHA